MKSKVVVLLACGMLALVLLTCYFALSRAGLPLGCMLHLGLPITGAGVLFALRLIDLGAPAACAPLSAGPRRRRR